MSCVKTQQIGTTDNLNHRPFHPECLIQATNMSHSGTRARVIDNTLKLNDDTAELMFVI